MSASTSLSSAIQSYELSAFAFVQKPFDIDQLFATVERALERRRMNLDNRRLVWELQTINEIADGIARSLELDDVLAGALECMVRRLGRAGRLDRLKNESTGLFESKRSSGRRSLQDVWAQGKGAVVRPSDHVIATRAAVRCRRPARVAAASAADIDSRGEHAERADAGGGRTARTCSVAAERPGPFRAGRPAAARRHRRASRGRRCRTRGCMTSSARQAGVGADLRRDEATRSRSSTATASLLRGNAALAAHLGRSITALRGASCDDVGVLRRDRRRLRGRTRARQRRRAARRSRCPTARSSASRPSRCPAAADGASVVQVAKNVTEEIHSARRMRQMSDELALANARLDRGVERLKSTQAQLLQAEKLSAIGQLVAGVAHELNNPLTSVIGYAQLLEEELRSHRARSAPGRRQLAAGSAAHRRGIRARRADRPQPAGVRAAPVGGARAAGRRRPVQPRARAARLRVPPERRSSWSPTSSRACRRSSPTAASCSRRC